MFTNVLTRMAINTLPSVTPRVLIAGVRRETAWSCVPSRSMSDDARSGSFEEEDAFAPNETESRDPSLGEKCALPPIQGMNSVTLLGRVGNDPQLRGTSVHPVVSFPMATNYRYRPGGPNSDQPMMSKTEWHNISVFRPGLRDNVLNNVTKGKRIFVQGRIMYGSIEDKLGNIRHTTTIVAEDIIRFA